jgi:hypothetical protein
MAIRPHTALRSVVYTANGGKDVCSYNQEIRYLPRVYCELPLMFILCTDHTNITMGMSLLEVGKSRTAYIMHMIVLSSVRSSQELPENNLLEINR